MTYAIIKTVCKVGFDETSVIVGYADSYSQADYVIERLAMQAQYGEISKGFTAYFSICEL